MNMGSFDLRFRGRLRLGFVVFRSACCRKQKLETKTKTKQIASEESTKKGRGGWWGCYIQQKNAELDAEQTKTKKAPTHKMSTTTTSAVSATNTELEAGARWECLLGGASFSIFDGMLNAE
jgi:hypothetical protein